MTQQTVAILEDLITGLKGTLHQYQDKKAGYIYPVGYSDEIEIGLSVLIQRVHLLWLEAKRNYHTDIISLTNSNSLGTCNPPRGIISAYREALDEKPSPREIELSREIELLREISRDRQRNIAELHRENSSLRVELDEKKKELVSLRLERSAERQTKPGAVNPSMSNVRKQQYENGQPAPSTKDSILNARTAEVKQAHYDKLTYTVIEDLIALMSQPARQSIAQQKISLSQSLQRLLTFALTQGRLP